MQIGIVVSMNIYREFKIDFTLPTAPEPGYTATKGNVVLKSPSRVTIEREVDAYIQNNPLDKSVDNGIMPL